VARALYDVYRVHVRDDGPLRELCARLAVDSGRATVLFDGSGDLSRFDGTPAGAALQRIASGGLELEPVRAFVSDDQLEAYKRTTYEAGVRIRVGRVAPLDSSWAFLTASNPGSKLLPDDLNAARRQSLEAGLRGRWRYRDASGVPDDPEVKPERGVLILGIDRESAVELGRRYGQNAIVFGGPDMPAEIVLCFPQS
jgi:uncharacterized protein DUF3293